ncbi:integrase core domain-containing protein [Comamonas aquatica]|nr:integrase core domain-containing protein [Comamonas aquatica]
MLDFSKLDCWIPANWIAGFQQTRLQLSGKLDCWVSAIYCPSLAHARVVVETWRREYNEERPKEPLHNPNSSVVVLELA